MLKLHTIHWYFPVIMAGLFMGCSGPGGGDLGNPMSASEELFAEGIAHLSDGDYEAARVVFNQLVDEPGFECRANYGVVLAGVQDTADRLDTIADAAALLLGGAPGYVPQQSIDIIPLVRNLLEPFAEFFEEVMVGLDYVVANECKVTVPEGMPIEIGNPDSLVYARAVFGYEFDAAAARAGQVVFASALSSIKFLLSHDLQIDAAAINQTINTVIDAFRGSLQLEVNGPGDVTIPTMITAIRSLGAVPADHKNLLKLADTERFSGVDNDILKVFRAIYYHDGATETGILPQLEKESARDVDTTDNFLGLVDANGNGVADKGDSIVIGLRELHITGLFSEPSIDDGIWLNLNPGLGDIDAIIGSVHEIVQVVGDQLASVDDDSVVFRNLGLQEVNDLIDAVTILDVFLTPLPEAVEFDFGAYFKNPVGVRDLFPYWIDGELLVEGESWVTTPSEPYVTFGDTAHFSGSYSFDDGSGDEDVLDDLEISADGIEPAELSILVTFPLPYVAYQDPSFNGVLYVDVDLLPIAPESTGDGMIQAGHYSVNKVAAAYYRFVLDEWLFSN